MTKATTTTRAADIQVGDFIGIPAWQTFGCVMAVSAATTFGSGAARDVLLQEHPDASPRSWRVYRLEDGEFTEEN